MVGRKENGRFLPALDLARPEESEYLTAVEGIHIPVNRGGELYILVKTDADGVVNEFPREDNNVQYFRFDVTPIEPADLVTSHVVAPEQAFEGTEIEVRYRVTNRGIGETSRESWSDSIWLTNDGRRPSFDNDFLLDQITYEGTLDVGEFYERVVRVTLPTGIDSGAYFIRLVQLD